MDRSVIAAADVIEAACWLQVRLADHRTLRFSSQAAESLAIQSSASASVLKPVMCFCCPPE
jgi:hypothetical protein